jgi:chitinase
VSSTITIKAKAFKSLMPDSDTASATYEIIPKVSTPTFSPDGGTYSSTQNVAISCATTGATIRFTVDGSEPSSSSTLYSSQILVSTTTTIKAKAFVAGITDSDTASATYTISAGGKVATPTFSPVGGSYSSAQSVVIQCATSGATIRYTTDGYEPGSSSAAYFGPISVSSTTTIKAKALMLGMTDSDIATSTYTITPTPSPEPLHVLIGVVAVVAIGLTVGEVLHRKKGNKEPT